MAGVKGRSGGARPGAGAPKKVVPPVVPLAACDMLTLLQDIALGRVEASAGQIRAAIAAVQYTHAKKGEGGKKEARNDAAAKVAGRFAGAAPPKLVAAAGRKLQ